MGRKKKPPSDLPEQPKSKAKPFVKPSDIANLSPTEEAFVHSYIREPVAAKAATDAGLARNTGSLLLARPEVNQAIQAIRLRHAERLEVNTLKVLRELARIGFSDIRNLFNSDGSLKNITELDDDTAAAVSSVEVYEEYAGSGKERKFIGYTKKVKFWNKVAAQDKLARHLGLIREAVDVNVQGTVEHEHTPKFDWDRVDLDTRRKLLAEVRRQEAAAGLQTDTKQLPYGLKQLVEGEVINGKSGDTQKEGVTV